MGETCLVGHTPDQLARPGADPRSLLLHPQLRTCYWRLSPLTQSATFCREHVQQNGTYSITSSARASSAAVMPSALAVSRCRQRGCAANLVLENVRSCLATTAMPDNRGGGSAGTGWRCISSPLSKGVVASCPVGSAGNLVKRGWRTTVSGPASNQGDSTFTLKC